MCAVAMEPSECEPAAASQRQGDEALAREMLLRLWLKLGHEDSTVALDKSSPALVGASSKREVRWMASGDVVCSIPASASYGAEVVAEVNEKAGVPEREQRLYVDGEELTMDTPLSCISSSVPLMLIRTLSDPRTTDLSHFHILPVFDELPRAGFTMIRKVSEGINGDIYRYRVSSELLKECQDEPCSSQATVDVAIKKLRNACLKRSSKVQTSERAVHLESWKNAPPEEHSLTEIGVLSYLSKQPDMSKYLIRMLGCFCTSSQTWLITEFADGGEIFDLVASSSLGDKAQRFSWELLQAVDYLHHHHIGHRDISLENILIKADSVKLMDFGLAVQSHSDSGVALRYFKAAGKNFYRAPECYVPVVTEVWVVAPPESKPGDVVMVNTGEGFLCEVRLPPNCVPGISCRSEVWGYAAQSVDIFATGMVICILCCGFPIWQKALLADPSFAYVHNLGDQGIASLLSRWQMPLPPSGPMQLFTEMLRTSDPSKRPSASDCLASPWLATLNVPH